MNEELKRKFAVSISDAFSPFILLLFFQIYTFIHYEIPLQHPPFLLLILFQMFFPALVIYFFRKTGRIADYDISVREERERFVIYVIPLYLISIYVIKDIPEVFRLNLIFAAVTILFGLITFWWKISAHTTINTISILLIATFDKTFFLLLLFLPLIAWSRLVLKRHTLSQVCAGFLLSLTVFLFLTQVTN